jgi:hypothetical protein
MKTKDLSKFVINTSKFELYLPYDISKLERSRTDEILKGDRILLSRTSNVFKAIYVDKNKKHRLYPTAHINILKLNNSDYHFYTSILNSRLVEYYLKIKFWHRQKSGFPRINESAIPQIPIPINKNPELVKEIEKLSKQFTNREVDFKWKENEFNELIYDLYGIGIIEKQRINDFFIKDKEVVKKKDLEYYTKEFCEYLADNIKQDIVIHTDIYDEKSLVKGICIVKIYLGKNGEEYPRSIKVGRYLLLELLKNVSKTYILTLRERIYGENTIYIIKDNLKKSWTLTKAGEDAVSELNKINKYNFNKIRNGK